MLYRDREADYARMDAAHVLETFRKYWRPESRFSVLVAPGTIATRPAPPGRDDASLLLQAP